MLSAWERARPQSALSLSSSQPWVMRAGRHLKSSLVSSLGHRTASHSPAAHPPHPRHHRLPRHPPAQPRCLLCSSQERWNLLTPEPHHLQAPTAVLQGLPAAAAAAREHTHHPGPAAAEPVAAAAAGGAQLLAGRGMAEARRGSGALAVLQSWQCPQSCAHPPPQEWGRAGPCSAGNPVQDKVIMSTLLSTTLVQFVALQLATQRA